MVYQPIQNPGCGTLEQYDALRKGKNVEIIFEETETYRIYITQYERNDIVTIKTEAYDCTITEITIPISACKKAFEQCYQWCYEFNN